MFKEIYSLFLYQPLLNTMVAIYNHLSFESAGGAIILLTVLVRIILYPIFRKGQYHQALAQKIQPKLRKIQQEHKKDKEKQYHATMELYKEHGTSMFAPLGPLFWQALITIPLYHVFLNIFKPETLQNLYPFIARPDAPNPIFLGLINLQGPDLAVVVLAAVAQYFQGLLMSPKPQKDQEHQLPGQAFGRFAIWLAPLITVYIFVKFQLPSAVALYWFISTLFSIGQQLVINKQIKNEHRGIS